MSTLLSKIVADFTTQLATAISTGGTTATLESITDDDGVTLPNGQYLLTIDGNNSQKEYWLCTLTGTSLTAIQNVSRQGARTAGCIRDHRVGASVSITDFAHILYINDLLTGTTNLNASTPLGYDGTASILTANQLATKAYVDGVAISGAPDASTTVKGISKLSSAPVSPTDPIAVGDNDTRVPTQSENDALQGTSGTPSNTNRYVTNNDTTSTPTADAVVRYNSSALIEGKGVNAITRSLTAGETINGATTPVAVWLDFEDNEWYACDGDNLAKVNFAGFAVSNGTNGNPIDVQTAGYVSGFSGLTPGAMYYVNNSQTLSVTPGSYAIQVGRAVSATTILIEINNPTFAERGIIGENNLITSYGNRGMTTLTSGWSASANTVTDAVNLVEITADSGIGSDAGSVAFAPTMPSGAFSTDFTYDKGFYYVRVTSADIVWNNSTANTDSYVFIGAPASVTTTATNVQTTKHMGFFIKSAANTGAITMFASVANGTTQTSVSVTPPTIVATTNVFEVLYVNNKVFFYINGVLQTTISTNIPTGSFNSDTSGFYVWTPSGTSKQFNAEIYRSRSFTVVATT